MEPAPSSTLCCIGGGAALDYYKVSSYWMEAHLDGGSENTLAATQ